MDTLIGTSGRISIQKNKKPGRMKKALRLKSLSFMAILFLTLGLQNTFGQGVGISESSITPHASSILELRSTERGFLIPRMTTVQRLSIDVTTPPVPTGLIVYDTDSLSFYYWDGFWVSLAASQTGFAPLTGVYTDANGNLTSAPPSGGTIGYWNRVFSTLSPSNAGDDITTSGDIYTSGTGNMTSAGLLTASDELNVTNTLQADDDVILGFDGTDALTVNAVATFNDAFTITDGATITNINNNTINIGNDAADVIDITGITNLNGGSVTIASDLTLATGATVNEIVNSTTGIDFGTPSDNALVTEAALTTVVGAQAGSGLTYNAGTNKIDLGGDLTTDADINVKAGTVFNINDDLGAATFSANENGNITIGDGTITTGTGQIDFNGNVDANAGLDVTNANLTVGATNFTVDNTNGNTNIAGTLDVDGATNLNANADIGNENTDVIDITGVTNINGGNLTVASPQTDLNSATTNVTGAAINIGDENTDVIDITGITNLNGGSVTIASDLTLATGATVNEIVNSTTGIDFGTPSDNALVTEAALTTVVGAQAGSGLTYNAGTNKIDLGGDLTTDADINVKAGTVFNINDDLGAATFSANENGNITIGDGTITTGTGQIDFNGNVDANAGLDVTNANLTVGATNFTVDNTNGNTNIAGTLDVDGATNLNANADIGNENTDVIDITGVTNINGGNLTVASPQTDLNSATTNVTGAAINIGDENTDVIDITGITNLNGGSVTIASDLTLATGATVNEIVNSTTGIDFGTPSDNALVTEAALTTVVGAQAGSGLTYNAGTNKIDLGGDLTTDADINVKAGTVFNINDDAGAAAISSDENGNITIGDGTITTGTGQIDFNGNVDATGGLDVTGADLTTNQAITQTGTNQVTFGGNVNANNGLDVAGADLTVNGGFTVTNGTGALDAGSTELSDLSFDASATTADDILIAIRADGTAADDKLVTEKAVRDAIIGGVNADNGLTENPEGTIILGGDLDAATTINTAAAGNTLTIQTDGGDDFIVDGTNGDLTVDANGNVSLDGTATFTTNDQVDFNGNVDANNGLDISGAALTIDNQAITQTTGGQVTFAGNLDATGGLDVTGADLTTNQAITQTGTNQVTFGGNVNANNGLDVAGADLTVNGGFTVTNGTGALDAGSTELSDLSFDASATTADDILIAIRADGTAADDKLVTEKAVRDAIIGGVNADNGLTENPEGTIILGGDLDAATTINTAAAGNTLTIQTDGGDDFIVDGTNGDLTVDANGNVSLDGTATFTTNDQVDFNGNVDANNGLDISGAALTIDNQAITQTTGGQVTFAGNLDATGGLDVTGADLTTNQAITQTGTNQVTFGGNVNANNGLDVAGADLTVNGGFTVTNGTGALDAGSTELSDLSFDASATTADDILIAIRADGTAADDKLVTEKAVRDAIIGGVNADNGLTENPEGTIILGGDLDAATTINTAAANNTLTIQTDGGDDFIVDGTNGDLTVDANGNVSLDGTATFTTNDQVDFNGNVDANNGLDISGAALTIDNQAITQTTGGQVTFAGNLDATGGLDVTGADLTTNQAITQTGTNQVTFGGNVNANNGLDVAGADLTVNGGFTVTNGTGALDAGSTELSDLSFDASATTADDILIAIRADGTAADDKLVTEKAVRDAIIGGVNADNGLTENPEGTIILGGDLDAATTINTAAAGNTLTIQTDGGDDFIVDGTNGDLTVDANGNVSLDGTATFTTNDQVDFNGNVDANAGIDVTGNITVTGNVDGRNVSVDGTTLDNLNASGLADLTSAEVDQLENIDDVTISYTQWGYLGNMNQGVATTDNVTFNQVTSDIVGDVNGNAATATALETAQSIYGNSFDGTSDLDQIIASTYGGTGNGFTKFSGPTTTEKTFILPDASATILTTNDAVTIAQGGTGASDATNAKTNLGLAIGSDVQAYDEGLNSIAGLTTAANEMIYTTAADAYAVTSLTAAGRELLDDADAEAQRTTLGLAIGTDIQAYDANLDDISALAANDGNIIVGDGSNFVAESGATARTSLGAAASGANTDITSVLLNQTGLVVKGGDDNALTIKPNETLTADRTLNIVTGDANRTLTFSDDADISGTNTGDQTITLTGDVTGTGTGSFAATIANNAVTYGKIQAVSTTSKLLGSSDASTTVQEITLGAGLTMTGSTISAAASTLANPTATIGLTAINGTAGSAMRSDGAPALSQAIVPTWTGAHTFTAGLTTNTADINGGNIDGTIIGGTTQAAGSFTTLSASDATTLNGAVTLGDDAADAVTITGTVQGANPLVFNAGNNNTTFAIDATGTDKTVTFPDASGTVAVTLTATQALDFPSVSGRSNFDLTITVNGASDGDAVILGTPNSAVVANTNYSAWVSAANTVTIRLSNYSNGNSPDPGSGTFRVSVLKY